MSSVTVSKVAGALLQSLPDWVPQSARNYILHTEKGCSIRELARDLGCHASTVSRQVKRLERRGEDILVDEALRTLGATVQGVAPTEPSGHKSSDIAVRDAEVDIFTDEETVNREARRILRRLVEAGAVLAVARDMEKAVVVRTGADGQTTRTATVDRPVANAIALKDWISCITPSRNSRYSITCAGRAALKQLIEVGDDAKLSARTVTQVHTSETTDPRAVRYSLRESPLVVLSRRKSKDGEAFLSDEHVSAGERLREDFELAQIDVGANFDWQAALKAPEEPTATSDAQKRVFAALHDLGPGLGDVVLRTCCYLEGLEAAERRMGWAARSGKVVLHIASERLKRHYADVYGAHGRFVG